MRLFITLFCLSLLMNFSAIGKEIPSDKIIKNKTLHQYLKKEVKAEITKENKLSEAILAQYFRQKFSERFFYDWQTFDNRFKLYDQLYGNQKSHFSRANDHIQKFAENTPWVLPFNYQNGKPVNAYALRHLARQHKMVDVAFTYFYEEKDPKYIQYFTNQMKSLNVALMQGKYEKMESGNGVYEVFRSGYRVLNWLNIHNMFLNEKSYSDENQLTTIATLLQHGADLYENNAKFHAGNHQTRGMSALAMLAILLRDFEGTDLWYKRAMQRLEEHLSKEINEDGFQFERSVHYHMSDIENYFFVYQLAKISKLEIDKNWENKLESLFTTLVKIGYPDGSAPVLQDDTNIPWAEKNDISGTMTLGYLLFQNPEFGYFASNRVTQKMYWFLSKSQIELLPKIEKKRPEIGSVAFEDTHYYIMREGWKPKDKTLIISAGLDKDKPDHQHADMLGIQGMAYGQVVLPNYQVRYSLKDFDLFKNSMVKNVALVDDELQGKKWTSNKGGSGFGKFKQLPNPKVITWQTNSNYDLFVGNHDGFEDIGVTYSRQVIDINHDFWIVKDNFQSEEAHTYKQVWQGHYTTEQGANLIRSTFADATGCDVLQLQKADTTQKSGARGKEWTIISKEKTKNFNFVTLIYPYQGYNNRINEDDEKSKVKGWERNKLSFTALGENLRSISKEKQAYLFGAKTIALDDIKMEFSEETDIFITSDKSTVEIHGLGTKELDIHIKGAKNIQLNGKNFESPTKFKAGDILKMTR